MLVAHGTTAPDPDRHHYPENEHVAESYDRYVGSGVVVAGDVAATDPVVLRGSNGAGETFEVRLTGTDRDLEPGDSVWLYGTARPDRTVAVETAIVRSDWEFQYMYVASALGGLLVLGRFVDGWRFDASRLAFRPRETPLSSGVVETDADSEEV